LLSAIEILRVMLPEVRSSSEVSAEPVDRSSVRWRTGRAAFALPRCFL